MPSPIHEALTALAQQGLNWVAFVPHEKGPLPEGCEAKAGSGLLMLLSLGSAFGRQTEFRTASPGEHPFDARAKQLTHGFMQSWLLPHDPSAKLVYPGPLRLDLRAWLEAGAVQHASELGIGIRPDCGPWLAVRSAVWVIATDELEQALVLRYPPLTGPSPCETCDSKPCLDACPVDAFRQPDRLGSCVEHRLRADTTCASRCHSRSACPVGSEHRYEEPQMSYHYGVSLRVIREWKAGQREWKAGQRE